MRANGQVPRVATALLLKHPDVHLTLFLRWLQTLKGLSEIMEMHMTRRDNVEENQQMLVVKWHSRTVAGRKK
jgi:hypothetical protein